MGKLTRWGVAVALAMGAGQVMAASAPASEDQVRQLMEVVGVGKMLLQMNTQAVTTLQQSMPCVKPEFWQNYMDDNQTQLFIGRLVPVWQHHFTSDEMDGLLKFYRSPLGQKVINEMPTTMAEANQAGQQWSHDRSAQMVNELKQMGTLDSTGRCPGKLAGPAPGAALAGGAAIKAAETGSDEGEAKPAAKATPHTKAPAKKPAAKPAPKKTTPAHAPAKASSSKTPAKTETKAPAKPDAKPATPPSGQGGQ